MKFIDNFIFVVLFILWELSNAIYIPNERTTKPPFVKSWRKIALQQHQMNSPVIMYHNYSRVTTHNQDSPQSLPPANTQGTQTRNYAVHVIDTDATQSATYPHAQAHEQQSTFLRNYDQQHLTNTEQQGTRILEQTYETRVEPHQTQRVHDKLTPFNQNVQINDKLGSFSGHTESQATNRGAKVYEFGSQQQTQHQFNEQFHTTSGQNTQGQKAIHDKLTPINPNMKIDDNMGSFGRYQEGYTYNPQRKPNYQVDPGRSNLPPLKDELEVFGYHYPPRPNEVYPFKKPPKPYSNMAFETCPKNVTGQLVYLWSCSQFINCWKGRGFIQNCAPGTMFNPETLECDFPHKVNCISGAHNQKVASEKLIASESQSQTVCKPNFSGLLPYPKDCKKFINCANGQTFIQDCGPGTAFNPTIQACDHPHNTGCDLKDDEVDTTSRYPYELTEHDVRTGRGHANVGSYQDRRPTSEDHQGYYSHINTAGHNSQDWDKNKQYGSNHARVVSTQHGQAGQTSGHVGGNTGYNNQHVGQQLPTLREVNHHYAKGQQMPVRNTGSVQGTHSTVQSSGVNAQYPHNCSPSNCQGQTQQSLGSRTNVFSSSHTIVSGRGENAQGILGTNHQSTPNQNPCTESTCQGQNHQGTTYHSQQGTVQGHYIKNYDQSASNSDRIGEVSTQQQYGYHQGSIGRGVARTSPYNTTAGQIWSSNVNDQNRGYTHTSFNQGHNKTQEITRPGRQNTNVGSVKCPPGHSGLLPHPFICEKFLNCANGGTFIQDCGPGTVFNPDLKVCDWPYKVKCTSSTTQSSPQPAPTESHSPGNPSAAHGTGYGYTQQGYNQTGRDYRGTSQGQYTGHTGHTTQMHTIGQQGWQIAAPTASYGTSQTTGYSGQTAGHIQGQRQIPVRNDQSATKPVLSYPGPTHSVSGQTGTGQTLQTGQNQNQKESNKHFVANQHGADYIYTSQTNQGQVPHPASQANQGGTYSSQGSIHTSQGGTYTSQRGQGKIIRNDGMYHGQGQIYTDQTREQSQIHPEQISQGQVHDYNSGTGHVQTPVYPGGITGGHGYIHSPGTGQSQATGNSHHSHTTTCNHTTTNYGNLPSNSQVHNPQDSRGTQIHNSQGYYGSQFIEPEPGIHTSNIGSHQSSSSDRGQTVKHNTMSYGGKQPDIRPHAYGTNVGTQTLTTSVNVHDSVNRKGSRHWPPPFPSTDTSADYYFEETTSSMKPEDDRKTWKSVKQCLETEFQCPDSCIPLSWVCNGYNDCRGGSDEKNCTHLQKFSKKPNHRLYKHEIEKWLNTNVETCAGYCLYSKSFACKSFNFKRENNVCLLCDTNVGLSGALTTSQQYDYYEISSLSVNCTNLYECSTQKCINFTQVCDGHDDCGNRMDEKNCSAHSLGYEIKLSGSHFKNEGRIEIKVFDEWGYICDDQFGLRDADVACKELGFPQGALEVKKGSHFAKNIKDNDTYYLMDDVSCFGNETSLRDCDFSGWGNHNCMPQEIVGVVCKTPEESCPKDHWKCDTTRECLPLQFVCDGVFDCADHSDEGLQHCEAPIEIRLVNGTSKNEGRVEVRFRGIWGTICDDDFNDLTAKVICKSLGYLGSAVSKKDAAFGAGEGPIWLDQLSCFGNESLLEDCAHWNWGEHNCEHNEDAGVVCSSLDTTEYEKKSKDLDTIHMALPSLPSVDTMFSGKCGHRGDDLFFDDNENDESDVHFRVVQGSTAKKGEYPWQATLRVRGVTKSSHWCGAVIISNKYVLTAAHCLVGFSKGSYVVRAGDYNVDENEGTEVEAYIEDFYIHDRFRQDGHMNNDIALIRLKGAGLHLSKQVQPICLPDKNVTYRHGMNCTISGFGSTETGKSSSSHILRAGWVSIQSQHVCKMPQVYGHSITDGMFCAGSLDEGVDSCDGDSGGPLACLDQGLFTLYGITSWGQRCGHANKPGVYVKVTHYRDWIDKKIQETS